MSVSLPKIHFVDPGVKGKKRGVCGIYHKAGRWTDEGRMMTDPCWGTEGFCDNCQSWLVKHRPMLLTVWETRAAREFCMQGRPKC